jgi:hypothetical protein
LWRGAYRAAVCAASFMAVVACRVAAVLCRMDLSHFWHGYHRNATPPITAHEPTEMITWISVLLT